MAKYADVGVAIADGYLPTEDCAESPAGGMGYHYVNPGLLGSVDPSRPPILLYVPSRDGVELAGVEWFHPDADQDLSTDSDRPSLWGIPFDGPMLGHEPGMPIHFDLHAWLYVPNPDGMFAPWNPRVHCG